MNKNSKKIFNSFYLHCRQLKLTAIDAGKPALAALFILFAIQSSAQKGGELKGLDVDVVKSYSPVLADPVKQDFPASTVKADSAKPKMSYSNAPKLLNLPFVPPDIRPLAMVKDEAKPTQNNYLKAGFGTQWSPLGELYLNTGVSDKYDAGFYAYHLSGSGNLKHQKFSDNIVQINGKKFFKKNALSAMARYDNHSFGYYGYDHNDTAQKTLDAIAVNMRQRYSKFSGELNFGNTKNKSLFDYNWHFGFYNLRDLYGAQETNYNTSLDLEKELKKIHHIHLRIAGDFNSFITQGSPAIYVGMYELNLFGFNPWYTIKQDNWSVKAGFNIVVPSVGDPFFFPMIEGEYKLAGEYLTPFAGWDGKVDKNNFEKLISINPFINLNQPQDYSKTYNIYGGVKGSMGNHVSYLLKISEQLYDNLPFFMPDTNSVTRFDVGYYSDAGEFNVHGEIAYREAEHINIIAGADYYGYQLDFNDTAIGYPSGKLSLQADYNIKDKLIFGANIYAYSKTYTILPYDKFKTALNGVVDFNLSVQYNYKKNFGAFININNIAATKYQRWYRYPSYGFNLIAGLMLKF